MIPQDFIAEWKKAVPWPQNNQVEQDLIICRALVDIFNHPDLQDQLAFRGGTALFKLHLPPLRIPRRSIWCRCTPAPSAR